MAFAPPNQPLRRQALSPAISGAAAVASLVVLCSSALAGEPRVPGKDAKEPPTETLAGLVGRLIALEVESSEEDTRWEEQEAHLLTTLSLLEKEKRRLDESLASAEKDADAAKTEREGLGRSIREAESLLAAVDESIETNGKRLLGSYRRCPEPLQAHTDKGAARVRDAVYGKAVPLTTAERLQLVSAFSQDCRRILGSVHAVKQIVELPGEEPVEADVLYLGGAVGYFVAPGDRPAGMMVRSGEGWKVVQRNDLARAVRRALAVFSKEVPPALVDLPVPAPADASKERGALP